MNLFSKKVLIYIPAFNCADQIISTVSKIPAQLLPISDVLIVDNCSTDGTLDRVLAAQREKSLDCNPVLIRTGENLGYSGSQKLAYTLATEHPCVQWVMMLHGDGQYPPELLSMHQPYLDSDCALTYGFRSKSAYGEKEETPWITYLVIKTLSLLESLITGYWRREWHTGFIMYSTAFLRDVDLASLTSTPHIDGHLLYCAGALNRKAIPLPIFKLYKELTAFEGQARTQYVLDVFKLMFAFKQQPVKRTAESRRYEARFEVLSPLEPEVESLIRKGQDGE